MSTDTLLLLVIAFLTVAELAAAVAIILFGPPGHSTDLIATIVGIVGPVTTSLLALWQVGRVRQDVKNGNGAAPPVPPSSTPVPDGTHMNWNPPKP